MILDKLSIVIPWLLSTVSICATLFAIHSAERQKRFEIYFDRKTSVYNAFLNQLSACYLSEDTPISALSSAYYQACLFAPSSVCHAMNDIIYIAFDKSPSGKEAYPLATEALLSAMREDLEQCQRLLSFSASQVKPK